METFLAQMGSLASAYGCSLLLVFILFTISIVIDKITKKIKKTT